MTPVLSMVEQSGEDDDETTAINMEVNGADQTRYVSVDMPTDQYEMLDDLKDEFGLTWRGLLVHTRRELDGLPKGDEIDTRGQYDLVNETRKRHGLTWKGMLLWAARDLKSKD